MAAVAGWHMVPDGCWRLEGRHVGDLGHLEGAMLVPIDELRARASEVPAERPLVVVCQTGRRSGLGATILKKAGVTRVASLAGGMLRWRELGLPS